MAVIGRNMRRRRAERGLTLIECMLALMIFPLAVTAIAYAIVAGQSQAVEAMRRTRASLLAEALMEEVLSLTYDSGSDASLGPEAGETTRDQYDSPNDFHGFSEAAGSLTDATGTACPQPMQRFSRSVSCSASSVTVSGFGSATDVLEVTVTVSDNGNPLVVLTRILVDQS